QTTSPCRCVVAPTLGWVPTPRNRLVTEGLPYDLGSSLSPSATKQTKYRHSVKMKKLLFKSFLCTLSASLLTLTTNARGGSGSGYTMDNAAGAHHVLAWKRAETGALSGPNVYATGGAGAGAGLSSQGSILLSPDGAWLFVCNAGSAEISVFAASADRLELTDKK